MSADEEKTTKKNKRLTDAQVLNLTMQAIMASLAGGEKEGETISRTTSRDAIQLTPVGAKQLLESLSREIQFPGKFSKKDIENFAAEYNKAANAQLNTVVRAAKEKITPGATEGEARRVVSDLLTTSFPSFFDPKAFTEDFIWSKINFGDEKSLTGKGLEALQKVRGVMRGYGEYILSDIEMQNAAKQIARGQKTEQQFIAELNALATKDYPTLANRLQSTPNATPRDLVKNYINLQAKILEMDPEAIDIDNQYIQRAIRPDGVGGAKEMMSIPDFTRFLLNTPEAEGTTRLNEMARQGATSLARAMGFGV